MINMQILQGNWEQIRGKLIERWGQLTNDDLTEFHGDADQLIGLIHRKTGESYEAVEKYLHKLADNATSKAAAATDTAREFAGRAARTVQHQAKEAVDQACNGLAEAKHFMRNQPLKALAIFFGVGLFTGLILALKRCSK
jgi:uncharacterized protein YjbJ (UPF0337 family)